MHRRRLRSGESGGDRFEHKASVGRPHGRVGGPLRVRHHTKHVAALVGDTGDIVDGTIRVGFERGLAPGIHVAEQYPTVTLQHGELFLIRVVAALAVGDGDSQHLSLPAGLGEGGLGRLDPQVNRAADKVQIAIAHKSAGQQAGFDENLEPVADADDEPASGGEALYGAQHGRKARDSTGTEVISVGKTARQHDRVKAGQVFRLVPHEIGGLAKVLTQRVERVVIAVRTRKENHSEAEGREIR